jgi:NADPH:quinone reductase-like Zn-dependent oxidoreductase
MRVCYAVGAEGFSPGWRLCETLGACFTKSMFSLEGKSAVVTGGASGIGLAIVERFVAAGAEVLLVDRKEVRAMALKLGALFHQADVSKEWEIEKMLETACERFGTSIRSFRPQMFKTEDGSTTNK